MSLSAEENSLRKKSRQDYTPPVTTPTALVTTTEKPTTPVTKNPTVTEKARYGACICILINFASVIYIHMLTLCLLAALQIDEIFQKEATRAN